MLYFFFKGAGSPIFRTVRLSKAILSGPPLSTSRAWVGSCGPRLRLLPTHRAPERGDLRLFLTEPQRVPCPWTENALRKKKINTTSAFSPMVHQGWAACCKTRASKADYFNKLINIFEWLPLCAPRPPSVELWSSAARVFTQGQARCRAGADVLSAGGP